MKDELLIKHASLDITLAVATVVGVTAGVLLSFKMEEDTLIGLGGVAEKLYLAADGNWFAVFLNSFLGAAVFLCAVFLCGFCAVAQPFEIALAAFRGLGLGICIRGIYLSQNILVSMAAFMPFAILSTWVLTASSKEAFSLSMKYLSLSVTNENRLGIRSDIRDYTARFMIYAALLAALAMIDTFVARFICRL